MFENGCTAGGTVVLYRRKAFASRQSTAEAAIKVACKRWSCLSCRQTNLWKFKKMVSDGCSILGPSVFITFTYRKRPGQAVRTALYVNETWRKFLRLWKYHNPKVRQTEWVKVIELTKQGQPHIHLILSWPCNGISKVIAKQLESETRAIWRLVTKDSFIVHVVPVTGAEGAGAYLAKYLAKDMDKRDQLLWLGFTRRYSRSRGWPKLDYHLRGIVDKSHGTWYRGPEKEVDKHYIAAAEKNPDLELAGDLVSMEMLASSKRKRRLREMNRYDSNS